MEKSTLLLFGILLTLTVTGQSHIFENIEKSMYKNDEWGRWVLCTSDIGVKTEPEGIYEISIYGYQESHPETVLTVKYSIMQENWFIYVDYAGVDKFIIKTNITLYDMSKGKPGVMFYFMDGGRIGYSLSNY